MKRCIVIINPTSGKNRKIKNNEDIKNIFYKHGYECDIILTEYKGHATDIVANIDNVDLVVSVGGDGTFNEIMTGNFKRQNKILVSHIPSGTANDIGAMYGYTKDLFENFNLLLNGEEKGIDICTINGSPFTYCAAFGKFTNISYETPKELKKKYGYLAYLIYGLKEIQGKTKLYDLEYKIDDNIYNDKYSFILISNANRIAGINNFYDNILLDDNKFEVLFCKLKTKREIMHALFQLTRNDITKIPGFEFHKVSSIKIKFNDIPEKGWCIDGEEYINMTDSFNIDIERNVKILLPNKNIKKLFSK